VVAVGRGLALGARVSALCAFSIMHRASDNAILKCWCSGFQNNQEQAPQQEVKRGDVVSKTETGGSFVELIGAGWRSAGYGLNGAKPSCSGAKHRHCDSKCQGQRRHDRA